MTLAKLHSFPFPHSHNTSLAFAGDLSTEGYTVQTSSLSDIKDVMVGDENLRLFGNICTAGE